MTATGKGAPFFIGGCPRSGLTLLRVMLDAHPEISCGPESPALTMTLAARDLQGTLGSLHEEHFELPPARVRGAFAGAIAAIIDRRREARNKRRGGEKSALNVLVFEDLGRMLPDALFLHVVRDGRDVAASLLECAWTDPKTGAPLAHCSDPESAIRYWAGLVGVGISAERSLGERVLRVRYEDLCAAPKPEVERICRFIGLPFSGSTLDFHTKPRVLAGLETQSAERLSGPVDMRSVGRWRRDFDAAAARAVERVAAPALGALGYL